LEWLRTRTRCSYSWATPIELASVRVSSNIDLKARNFVPEPDGGLCNARIRISLSGSTRPSLSFTT
jgi:hypothetical protein